MQDPRDIHIDSFAQTLFLKDMHAFHGSLLRSPCFFFYTGSDVGLTLTRTGKKHSLVPATFDIFIYMSVSCYPRKIEMPTKKPRLIVIMCFFQVFFVFEVERLV